MVDSRVNDSISDRLSHDLLGLFYTFQAQLARDVGHGDLRVRDIDLFQTELDDGMLQSMDQTEHLVSLEHPLVPRYEGVESLHVSLLDRVHDLIVWVQVLLEVLLAEDLTIGDLTHEQLYNDEELLSVDAEADSSNLGCFSEGLDQGGLGLRVLQLDCLDATLVVQVPRILIVRDGLGEACLHDEVASLLVQVLLQVGSNDDVHCSSLANLVLVQATVLVRFENHWPDLSQSSELLVSHSDEVDRLCCKRVNCAKIYTTTTLQHEVSEFFRLKLQVSKD